MTVYRACDRCRTAKTRCDLQRPSCGRCARRGLPCVGYPEDSQSVFRSENERAQRASERARRGRGSTSATAISFDVPSLVPQDSYSSQGGAPPLSSPGVNGDNSYSWLSDYGRQALPEPLKRNKESRAIDRFFVDWTLHPANNGVTPGHLSDLPMLYLGASEESVLTPAVRAMAFADLRNAMDGNEPFYVKARRNYGTSLIRMREAAADEQQIANDRVLAALLLIDNFEGMYLARNEPLGPHNDAVKHILFARGEEPLHSRHSFALWRIAHHRLQNRQVLDREGPDPCQIEWMKHLNTNLPDIRLSADVLHMNMQCAAARKLTENGRYNGNVEELTHRADNLAHQIKILLDTIANWTARLPENWKTVTIDSTSLYWPGYADPPDDSPPIPTTEAIVYRDLWLNYMFSWHSAVQIVLRESLIEVIDYSAKVAERNLSEEEIEFVDREKYAVEELSNSIIQSYPQLLGYSEEPSQSWSSNAKGRMVGKYFLLFPTWVLQRSRYTRTEQKQAATSILDWIHATYGIK